MSLIDAQGTTFTFDGTTVGGIESYEFKQGESHAIPFKSINRPAVDAVVGLPDFGLCVLRLYRDAADAGQVKLMASLSGRIKRTCVVTYKDGTTETFQAYCLTFPVVGSKGTERPLNISTVTLRITGTIS